MPTRVCPASWTTMIALLNTLQKFLSALYSGILNDNMLLQKKWKRIAFYSQWVIIIKDYCHNGCFYAQDKKLLKSKPPDVINVWNIPAIVDSLDRNPRRRKIPRLFSPWHSCRGSTTSSPLSRSLLLVEDSYDFIPTPLNFLSGSSP